MPRQKPRTDRSGTVVSGPGYRLHMRTPDPLPPETERQFQDAVLKAAQALGWRTYHTWNSMHSAGGFPDLVLVRRPRVIFAELKSERTKVTDDQHAWLADLGACDTVESYLWRPSDWDALVEVLKR